MKSLSIPSILSWANSLQSVASHPTESSDWNSPQGCCDPVASLSELDQKAIWPEERRQHAHKTLFRHVHRDRLAELFSFVSEHQLWAARTRNVAELRAFPPTLGYARQCGAEIGWFSVSRNARRARLCRGFRRITMKCSAFFRLPCVCCDVSALKCLVIFAKWPT